MKHSSRLQKGMLCALLCFDKKVQQYRIQYFNISQRHSTLVMDNRMKSDKRAAFDITFLPDTSSEDISQTMSIVTSNQAIMMI